MIASNELFGEYECKPLDEKYFGFKILRSSDFKKKRIPKGVKGDDVYRLLPYDPKVEYGGYITPRNIFYRRGEAIKVLIEQCKEVTFHTHPKLEHDMNAPSPGDLFNFVHYSTRRHILGGALAGCRCSSPIAKISRWGRWQRTRTTSKRNSRKH